MEILNQILNILFYLLFISWAFFKMRNIILINKLNCKNIYKNIKKDIKKEKISKYLFIIIIAFISIFLMYLLLGLIVLTIAFLMIIITMGGTMYVDTRADSTFFDNIMNIFSNYFSLFNYIGYYLNLIVYLLLIRAIYINVISYKRINDEEIKNDIE